MTVKWPKFGFFFNFFKFTFKDDANWTIRFYTVLYSSIFEYFNVQVFHELYTELYETRTCV